MGALQRPTPFGHNFTVNYVIAEYQDLSVCTVHIVHNFIIGILMTLDPVPDEEFV